MLVQNLNENVLNLFRFHVLYQKVSQTAVNRQKQPQQFIALATTPFENGTNTFVVNNSQLIFSSPDLPK